MQMIMGEEEGVVEIHPTMAGLVAMNSYKFDERYVGGLLHLSVQKTSDRKVEFAPVIQGSKKESLFDPNLIKGEK